MLITPQNRCLLQGNQDVSHRSETLCRQNCLPTKSGTSENEWNYSVGPNPADPGTENAILYGKSNEFNSWGQNATKLFLNFNGCEDLLTAMETGMDSKCPVGNLILIYSVLSYFGEQDWQYEINLLKQ